MKNHDIVYEWWVTLEKKGLSKRLIHRQKTIKQYYMIMRLPEYISAQIQALWGRYPFLF